jgi:hypothetical protein
MTLSVATPSGVLAGMALFNWDGSAWQPSGRAMPSVATPAGVLRGVAAFNNDGTAWQPAGSAAPSVPTPSGVIEGVAVFTWNGTAWVPTGGRASVPTPSGVLRGIAAFSWDGSAWQPAGQARPSIPTPYGVLEGVACYNWNGSAWVPGGAQPPADLDLVFTNTTTLDPRVTFTRNSIATYFDATGTMRVAPVNTIRNSTMQGVVAGSPGTAPTFWIQWANNPGGSGMTQTIIGTGTENGLPYIDVRYNGTAAATSFFLGLDGSSSIAAVNGQTWTISAYMKLVAGSWANVTGVYVAFSEFSSTPAFLTSHNMGVISPGATLTRVSGTAATNQATCAWVYPNFGFTLTNGAAVDFTLRLAAPQLELSASAGAWAPTINAANGAPRFDYDPATLASRGLLIEEARTNLLFPSGDISTLYPPTNATLTGASGTAPDGTNTMSKLAETATSGVHSCGKNVTVTASTQYNFAIYAKAVENRYVQLFYDDGSNGMQCNFDLVAGVVGTIGTHGAGVTAGAASIVAVGNGVYRCSISGTTASTVGRTGVLFATSLASGWAPSYAGVAGNGALLWGAQLEQGTFPTSYIPTTSAAVTRAIDSAILTSAPIFGGGAIGRTVAIEGYAIQNTASGTNCNWIALDDGTASNEMVLLTPSASGNLRTIVAIGSSFSVNDNDTTTGPRPGVFKAALANGAVWNTAINGALIAGSGGASSLLPSLSRMQLGTGGIAAINGHLRRARYWSRALSAADLITVTT